MALRNGIYARTLVHQLKWLKKMETQRQTTNMFSHAKNWKNWYFRKVNTLIFYYTNIPHSNESRKNGDFNFIHSGRCRQPSTNTLVFVVSTFPLRKFQIERTRWHCIQFKNMWLHVSLWNCHFIGRVFRITAKALFLLLRRAYWSSARVQFLFSFGKQAHSNSVQRTRRKVIYFPHFE